MALYKLRSWHKNGHGIHSPFVYCLVTQTFKTRPSPYVIQKIQQHSSEHRNNPQVIAKTSWGAGSFATPKGEKTVGNTFKTSSITPKYGKLLHGLAKDFKPKNIVEIGTCLGVSSTWLALGNPLAKVTSLEGNDSLAALASRWFDGNGMNCTVLVGEFSTTLPKAIQEIESADLVFFDGNHNEESTLEYFTLCLTKANNQSIFVFDDIYWSPGMERAWQKIKEHPSVSITIDTCRLGIVFFDKRAPKQHYVIRY